MLFREEADDTRLIGRPSFREDARSTEERWIDATDEEATEGHLDSFTDDKEADEFPLTDTVLSAEIKEEIEEDTEEVCWVRVSLEEGVRWEEAVESVWCFWSFPFEEAWDMEREEAAGVGAVEDEPACAVGEDGGEVWDNPFFSEECEDRDSWLPIGVVPGLLLNVSPGETRKQATLRGYVTMAASR